MRNIRNDALLVVLRGLKLLHQLEKIIVCRHQLSWNAMHAVGAFAAFLACGNGSVERLCRPAYHSHEHHGGNCREGNRDRDRRKAKIIPFWLISSSYVASLTFEEIKQGAG